VRIITLTRPNIKCGDDASPTDLLQDCAVERTGEATVTVVGVGWGLIAGAVEG
jgi:hypothetical protein